MSLLKGDTGTVEDSYSEPSGNGLRSAAHLFLVLECDRPQVPGARYSLTGIDEIIVGRGVERHSERELASGIRRLRLRVPGPCLSSVHARIVRSEDGWLLEDMRSTNGTFIRGERVQRAVLGNGAVFELGHTFFVLRTALPTPEDTACELDLALEPPPDRGLATLLPALQKEFSTLAQVARSPIPILLLGDTGTGKEEVARAVHRLSSRTGPFLAVNCGALTPNLVESHFFGHVKGSFSGAVRDEMGVFRAAQHGTLLLDEIGDLPAAAQAVLLRALQEQEVTPVGAARGIPIDVRVLAATHQPLDAWVTQGRFRRDLLGRMGVHRLTLPSLQDRREDMGALVAQTLNRAMSGGLSGSEYRLSTAAGLGLLTDEWPLNIRELVHRLERALALATDSIITQASLGLPGPTGQASRSIARRGDCPQLSAADLQLKSELLRALERHKGNVAQVAQVMGKKRMQIHRWMKRFEVDPASFRGEGPTAGGDPQ